MSHIARLIAFQRERHSLVGADTVRPHPLALTGIDGLPSPRLATDDRSSHSARNDLVMNLDLPESWRTGLISLSGMAVPDELTQERWKQIRDDADHVALNWAGPAFRCGWTMLDLFGCARGFARRLDQDGLAVLLFGRKVISLDAECATILVPTNDLMRYHRMRYPTGVPIWAAT